MQGRIFERGVKPKLGTGFIPIAVTKTSRKSVLGALTGLEGGYSTDDFKIGVHCVQIRSRRRPLGYSIIAMERYLISDSDSA